MPFNTTSVVLVWQHPENIFNELLFNYTITATVVSTGRVIQHYTAEISSGDSPRQLLDLSSVGVCEAVNFTVSLVEDCREISAISELQICKSI